MLIKWWMAALAGFLLGAIYLGLIILALVLLPGCEQSYPKDARGYRVLPPWGAICVADEGQTIGDNSSAVLHDGVQIATTWWRRHGLMLREPCTWPAVDIFVWPGSLEHDAITRRSSHSLPIILIQENTLDAIVEGMTNLPGAATQQVAAIIAHEVGHAVGMGHTGHNIMEPTVSRLDEMDEPKETRWEK